MPSSGEKEPAADFIGKLRSFFGPKPPRTPQDNLPPGVHFSIWYFVAALLLISALQQYLFSRRVETISYSQFKQQVAVDNVDTLAIGPESISGTLKGKDKKPGQDFVTVRVEDPGLVKDLDAHKVNYSGRYDSKFFATVLSWILPIGILFLIWRFAMKKMGPGMGVMSFGKSKAKLFAESETKVTFADVAGIDEAKEELEEVVEFLRKPEKFQKLGGGSPKGSFWWALPEPEKPFWPGLWPGRRKSLSSASAARSSWRCSSAWARRAFETFSPRPQARHPASFSSMNWTRWEKPAA